MALSNGKALGCGKSLDDLEFQMMVLGWGRLGHKKKHLVMYSLCLVHMRLKIKIEKKMMFYI